MKNNTIGLSATAIAVLLALSSNVHAIVPSSVSASSNDGNVEQNTIDNDLSTRWSAEGDDGSQWLQYDFSGTPSLSAVNIAFYKGDQRSTYFQIQSSDDGSDWEVELDTVSSAATTELETFTLDDTVTSPYLRIVGFGNSSNAWNSIAEVTFDESTDEGTKPVEEIIPVTGDTYTATPDSLNDVLAIAVGGDEIIVSGVGEISIKNISFDSPVLIRAETIGGQQLENATISNSNNITLQGFLFGPSNDVSTLVKIVNSTNIRVSRNYFDHLNVTEGQSSLVVTESSQYIEIDYNEFHDKNISVVDGEKNTGSYIKFQYDDGQMTKDAHIHHNYFNNITPYLVDGTPAGDSDREAIVMGISSSQDIVTNNIVEYNLFENCDGENEIITVKTSNNTFRYNTFKNSMGSLSFRLGHDNEAYGNYFYGTGAGDAVTDDNYQTGGIRVYGAGHNVYDNYMEGLSGTSWRLPLLVDNGDTSDSSNGDSHQTPTDINITNNTIVDSTGGGIYIGRADSIYKNSPTNITVTGNTVIGSEGTLFNNYSDDSSNTWSGNTAYASGAATANGGGVLNSDELAQLSSAPTISAPTPLIPSDVGTTAE